MLEATLQQVKDAVAYYEYIEETYRSLGKVTHVTGNALGGPLANVVAMENEHVRSVALSSVFSRHWTYSLHQHPSYY